MSYNPSQPGSVAKNIGKQWGNNNTSGNSYSTPDVDFVRLGDQVEVSVDLPEELGERGYEEVKVAYDSDSGLLEIFYDEQGNGCRFEIQADNEPLVYHEAVLEEDGMLAVYFTDDIVQK